MPRKFENPSGRISIRLSVETHEALGRIARSFNTDLTALINMMIEERLPAYRLRVALVAQEKALADEIEKADLRSLLQGLLDAKEREKVEGKLEVYLNTLDRVGTRLGQLLANNDAGRQGESGKDEAAMQSDPAKPARRNIIKPNEKAESARKEK